MFGSRPGKGAGLARSDCANLMVLCSRTPKLPELLGTWMTTHESAARSVLGLAKRKTYAELVEVSGCDLGANPARPRLGDEGLADGFRVDEGGLLWSSMADGFCVIDPTRMEVICEVVLRIVDVTS